MLTKASITIAFAHINKNPAPRIEHQHITCQCASQEFQSTRFN